MGSRPGIGSNRWISASAEHLFYWSIRALRCRRVRYSRHGTASIAVLYVLTLGVIVYRTIPLSEVPEILVATARISGTILFIAATSQIAAWIFAYEGLPDKVAVLLEGMNLGPTWGLIVIFVFLLLVGIFMEAIPAMFILIPVMMPPVLALGIDVG